VRNPVYYTYKKKSKTLNEVQRIESDTATIAQHRGKFTFSSRYIIYIYIYIIYGDGYTTRTRSIVQLKYYYYYVLFIIALSLVMIIIL